MIKPLATRFLQHLISQNNWARQHLIPYAGKIIVFNFSIMQMPLLILEDGSLCMAGETAQADATVHIPPSLALRLFSHDEMAKSFIKIDGDTGLATEISKVLQQMRWDIEEDLSLVVGDVAAFKISELSKKTFAEIKRQSINATEMLTEYWQEEKNILAKKHHVEQFNHAVDTLREDTERFQKRLEKFEAKLLALSVTHIPKKSGTKKSISTKESL